MKNSVWYAINLTGEDIEILIAILVGAQEAAGDMGEPQARIRIMRLLTIFREQRIQ